MVQGEVHIGDCRKRPGPHSLLHCKLRQVIYEGFTVRFSGNQKKQRPKTFSEIKAVKKSANFRIETKNRNSGAETLDLVQ